MELDERAALPNRSGELVADLSQRDTDEVIAFTAGVPGTSVDACALAAFLCDALCETTLCGAAARSLHTYLLAEANRARRETI